MGRLVVHVAQDVGHRVAGEDLLDRVLAVVVGDQDRVRGGVEDGLKQLLVGAWGGRTYADIIAEQGEIMDREALLFSVRPPGGEWYDDIATRMSETVSTYTSRVMRYFAVLATWPLRCIITRFARSFVTPR